MHYFVPNIVTLLPTLAAFFVTPHEDAQDIQIPQQPEGQNRLSFNESSCSGGICTQDAHLCFDRGGTISGLCSAGIFCCKNVYTPIFCGETSTGEQFLEFKSAQYPQLLKGDLTCEVKIILKHDTKSIRVDFIDIQMDGQAYLGSPSSPGQCESDIILFKGFESWTPPPRCGNLTGYSFLIDTKSPHAKEMETFRMVNLMSSPSYRWHIKISLSPGKRLDSTTIGLGELSSTSGNDTKSEGLNDILELVKNGNITDIKTVPWQVSIRRKGLDGIESELQPDDMSMGANCSKAEGSHFCGGAIIGERFILTAAHCLEGTSKVAEMVDISSIKVVVGDSNLCSDDLVSSLDPIVQPIDYDVESVILHYAYDSHLVLNDIAVMRLKFPIKADGYFTPIELAKPDEQFTGQDAVISGYGESFSQMNETDGYSYGGSFYPFNLQSSRSLTILKQPLCILTHWGLKNESQEQIVMHPKYASTFNSTICTYGMTNLENEGGNGTRPVSVGVGKGDSGGPLVVYRNTSSDDEATKRNNLPVLAGVVSVGREIYGLYFSFYTSVAFYREWIDLVIASFE